MSDFANQREFTRVPIMIEVRATSEESGGKTIASGRTKDLSMKGIYLSCDEQLPVGTECRVVMLLRGSKRELRIEAAAKVARADDSGMGIEFSEIIGTESFDHLRKLVLYNSRETEQVEREFESHLGIKRRI